MLRRQTRLHLSSASKRSRSPSQAPTAAPANTPGPEHARPPPPLQSDCSGLGADGSPGTQESRSDSLLGARGRLGKPTRRQLANARGSRRHGRLSELKPARRPPPYVTPQTQRHTCGKPRFISLLQRVSPDVLSFVKYQTLPSVARSTRQPSSVDWFAPDDAHTKYLENSKPHRAPRPTRNGLCRCDFRRLFSRA